MAKTSEHLEMINAYLDQLDSDKADMVDNLNDLNVEASDNETFTELVPKLRQVIVAPTPNGSLATPFIEDLTVNINLEVTL